MTAAKVMDIISRLPGCDGQAADAEYRLYTQVKMEDAHKITKILKSECVQTFGFVYHDTNGLNHGPVWKLQSFLLKGICTVILWQGYYGERQFEKILLKHGWEKIPNWECLSLYIVKKYYSYLCMWMT